MKIPRDDINCFNLLIRRDGNNLFYYFPIFLEIQVMVSFLKKYKLTPHRYQNDWSLTALNRKFYTITRCNHRITGISSHLTLHSTPHRVAVCFIFNYLVFYAIIIVDSIANLTPLRYDTDHKVQLRWKLYIVFFCLLLFVNTSLVAIIMIQLARWVKITQLTQKMWNFFRTETQRFASLSCFRILTDLKVWLNFKSDDGKKIWIEFLGT